MAVPLYQAKAEFFRMLGHPVRIRVLELLQDGPLPVRELLAAIEVEPSSLSQQLAVLRRSGIVTATREGYRGAGLGCPARAAAGAGVGGGAGAVAAGGPGVRDDAGGDRGARDRLREAGVLVPGHAAGAKTAVAASVAGTHAAAAAEEAAR
ncbi:hypothetical protein SMICM17S_10559 [Streptomyces microflavus]